MDDEVLKFNCTMEFSASEDGGSYIETVEIDGIKHDVVNLVAAIGDIFYQGVFISKDLLRKVASNWNGTIHDISHMATNYPNGWMGQENIEYAVGFHKKASFDEKIGGVTMKAFISHNSPKYKAWRNYVDICRNSNKIPNTSMFVYGKFGMLDTKELPKGVKVPKGASDSQGNVMYLKEAYPAAVTTCLRGKCDDKDGCGIGINDSCDCELEPQEDNQENSEYKEYLSKRLRTIKK